MKELEDAHLGRGLRLLEGVLVSAVICGVFAITGGQLLPSGTNPAQAAGQTIVLLTDTVRSVSSETDLREPRKNIARVRRDASYVSSRVGNALEDG